MKKNAGLTLVELLIALSLAAIVLAALSMAFRAGLDGYRAADERSTAREPALRFFLCFADDIRPAFAYSLAQSGFRGGPSEVEFFTLVERWGRDDADRIFRTRPRLARVVYRFGEGRISRGVFMRGAALVETPGVPLDVVADRVRSLDFLYGRVDPVTGAETVLTEWSDPTIAPDWVEVRLGTSDGENYRRTFHLER